MPGSLDRMWRSRFIAYMVLIALTLILSSVAFFGPNGSSASTSKLSFITISPSTKLQPPNLTTTRTTTPDGPTLSFGIFGSCAQSRSEGVRSCTGTAFNPKYNFSFLPPNTPTYVLVAPPFHLKLFGYIAYGLWPCLILILVVICCRPGLWDGKYLPPAFLWFGMIACVISCVNFWALSLYFDTVCYNFNHFVARQGAAGPLLMAARGRASYFGYFSLLPFCLLLFPILRELADDAGGGQGNGQNNSIVSSSSSVTTLVNPSPAYSLQTLADYTSSLSPTKPSKGFTYPPSPQYFPYNYVGPPFVSGSDVPFSHPITPLFITNHPDNLKQYPPTPL